MELWTTLFVFVSTLIFASLQEQHPFLPEDTDSIAENTIAEPSLSAVSASNLTNSTIPPRVVITLTSFLRINNKVLECYIESSKLWVKCRPKFIRIPRSPLLVTTKPIQLPNPPPNTKPPHYSKRGPDAMAASLRIARASSNPLVSEFKVSSSSKSVIDVEWRLTEMAEDIIKSVRIHWQRHGTHTITYSADLSPTIGSYSIDQLQSHMNYRVCIALYPLADPTPSSITDRLCQDASPQIRPTIPAAVALTAGILLAVLVLGLMFLISRTRFLSRFSSTPAKSPSASASVSASAHHRKASPTRGAGANSKTDGKRGGGGAPSSSGAPGPSKRMRASLE